MATKLEVKEYKNSIGQVIQPGDEVAFVTTGYGHSVGVGKGTYLGMKGNGCSIKVWNPRTRYRHKDTGIEVDYWWNDKRVKELEYPRTNYSIRYGTSEYTEEQARYKAALDVYTERRKAIEATYEAFQIPGWRNTTLQRNRMFKLDTSLNEVGNRLV